MINYSRFPLSCVIFLCYCVENKPNEKFLRCNTLGYAGSSLSHLIATVSSLHHFTYAAFTLKVFRSDIHVYIR